MKIIIWCLVIVLLTALCISCNPSGEVRSQPSVAGEQLQTSAREEAQKVEVIVLRQDDFRRDIASNGRLTALRKSDVEFRTRERIASINVGNGDHIAAGKIIASLDTFTLFNALSISRDQYERSMLEFNDLLLARGHGNADTALIPRQAVKAARVRSGLDRAQADLCMAEFNLNHAHLRAPFAGVVANLFAHENEMSAPGKVFCSVIDYSRFIAYFPVLESELPSLHKGQTVRILPFMSTSKEHAGVVTSVNPVVDNNGMVKIGAVADNRRGELFEGMNVKVIAGEMVPGQLVIPRQAVVLRSGKQVVFTFSNGRAKWVYVTTGMENLDSFAVTEGLKEGDTIIVRGNFNLNHDSRVVLK